MDENNRIMVTKVLGTTIGVGLIYLLARHRKQILRQMKGLFDYKNPLRYQEIKIVNNPRDCEVVAEKIARYSREYNVVGFDCEWVTSKGKRNPVALLQLATYNGFCALIRLCCMPEIPEELRRLLEDENIVKVGVEPYEDAMLLAYDYGMTVSSTLDLRHLASLAGRNPEGLAKMADKILNVKLNKHWRLRCSNWEAPVFTEEQKLYAANDAHVAIEIFKCMEKDLLPGSMFKFKADRTKAIVDLCAPFLNIKFKPAPVPTNPKKESKKNLVNNQEKTVKSFSRNMCTRTKQLYDNCFLEAPDGELLCTCDKKKADWYVTQNLGEVVEDTETYTVRLKFEPAGRAVGEVGKYYQTAKENQCVVCGRKDAYIRKNVVPREYRKHFPLVMKTHTSHDVLLLCPRCHQLSNLADLCLRKKLAKMCNAPIVGSEPGAEKALEIPEMKTLRSAARALQGTKHEIPEERKKHLQRIVLDAYPEESEITEELLKRASDVETIKINENYCAHGSQVVNYFKDSAGGLIELEKMWRTHFLNTMKPKYMPDLWSVSHNAHRLEIRAKEGRIDAEDMIVAGLDPSTLNGEAHPDKEIDANVSMQNYEQHSL